MKKVIMICVSMLIIAFTFTGCTEKEPTTFDKQSTQNEQNVKDLISRQELPKLTRSQDFDNVKRRLEYLNQANNLGYLYLLTENGQLIKEVQVAGKVTSLNTYITPMEEFKAPGTWSDGSSYAQLVSAPDLDGTYGENVNGVFWFTPDGVYQEWIGLYLFSSERLSFTTQPLLIEKAE